MSSGSDEFLRAYATVDFEVLVAQAAPPQSATAKRTFSETAQDVQDVAVEKDQTAAQQLHLSDTEESEAGQTASPADASGLEQMRVRVLQKLDGPPESRPATEDADAENSKAAELEELRHKVKKLRNANRGGRNKVYYEVLKKLGPAAASSFWAPAPTSSASASTASSSGLPIEASTPPFKAPPPEPVPPQPKSMPAVPQPPSTPAVPPPPPAEIYAPIDWTQSSWWHASSSWQGDGGWWQ